MTIHSSKKTRYSTITISMRSDNVVEEFLQKFIWIEKTRGDVFFSIF